ncbi:hypothetical protein THAOC_14032 [Thalassiosira oceanica]|uniref:peptide-methionine (S)-S-oxide reductase n=1 Tax=Thalassiosira oceanica TaxID=159749 RepID=K0SIJ5_THAOC|nr:hypothetical protein THAOC_14032 [Thalassiosira oceanica]|eukprot:EJK65150.1 hypothetical protein THAOC_14032 [Thalassiosira oceanica]
MAALKEATFGMGTAESLLKRPGIIETAAGYTGAPDNAKRPNYDSVCFGKDWVEGVRVVYDDEEVTYEELLDEFMVSQKPGYQRQYASVIFVDDKDEEKAARQWIKRADPAVLERRKDGLTYDVVENWDKLRFKAFAGVLLIIGDDGPWFAPVRDELEQFRLPLGADSLSFNGVCQAILFAGMIWLLVERLLQQLDVFGGSRELRRVVEHLGRTVRASPPSLLGRLEVGSVGSLEASTACVSLSVLAAGSVIDL